MSLYSDLIRTYEKELVGYKERLSEHLRRTYQLSNGEEECVSTPVEGCVLYH